MRSMQEGFPNPPSISIRRVVGADRTWVLEGVNDYGDDVWRVVNVLELAFDGRILRETRYYERFSKPQTSGETPSKKPSGDDRMPAAATEPTSTDYAATPRCPHGRRRHA